MTSSDATSSDATSPDATDDGDGSGSSSAAGDRAARSRGLAISAGGLAVLLGALDTYVVLGLLRQIVEDLQVPLNRIERVTPIVTGYLLGYVAAMPLLGQASDRFGRKALLQTCLTVFIGGSVLTAAAESVPLLVAGRVVLGVAGGALLPVTLALAADLWSQHRRAAVLGAVGGAQELGSVLGPVYGIALAGFAGWRAVFWVNVPLALLAMVVVHLSIRGGRPAQRQKADVVGASLLAVALGLLVVALYNPEPQQQVLPSWGPATLIAAAAAFVAFVGWEVKARTRLLDTANVQLRPFFTALGASLAAGAALMVTLVDVELFAQTLLGERDHGAVLLLLRFLIALPVGAVIGGLLANRIAERWVSAAGLLVAACGFLLMSQWPADVLSSPHELGPLTLPRLDTDLVLVGIGLGLVIAPLSAVVLRVVPSDQHGMASAAVVVARMTGMLVGISALSAWGLHRFHTLTAELQTPLPMLYPNDAAFDRAAAEYAAKLQDAMLTQYTEIFAITAVVCVVGAGLSLLTGPRRAR